MIVTRANRKEFTPTSYHSISLNGLSCGVDVVDLTRFHHALEKGGEQFKACVFRAEELVSSKERTDSLAVRFAAKEATAKMLGTGMRGISWQEIEVWTAPNGAPHLRLHGRAEERAAKLGIEQIALSLTHDGNMGAAFVVASNREETS